LESISRAAGEPRPWTPRRWFYAIAVSLVVQVGLLFYLGERHQAPVLPARFRTANYLAGGPEAEEQLKRLPTLTDPTLFALPSQHGFSARAWLSFQPLQYRLADWSEPPRWLEVDTTQLGRISSQLVLTNIAPPMLIADKPLPRLIGSIPAVPALSVRDRSVARAEGDLARRRWLDRPELPSWPHSTDLLTNTVVQLTVDASGRALSAVLLAGSGLAAADQFALEVAKAARFAPWPRKRDAAAQDALTSGRMVFLWHTTPPQEAAPLLVPP
jgi:TonB family protein